MEQKTKFVIIGLIAILVISLLFNIQTLNLKQAALQERDKLKEDNASLVSKAEESLKESRRLQEKNILLSQDLTNRSKELEEIKRKYELVDKERAQLAEKIKSLNIRSTAPTAVEQVMPKTEDAYWAGVLKTKTELEIHLDSIRNELKSMQATNKNLEKEKSALGLDISGLKREKDELKRQLEYNQKLIDSISQELVREKIDKLQIEDSIKLIKNENVILRRQLNSLNRRRDSLEKKLAASGTKNAALENKFSEMDAILKEKVLQINKLNRELTERQGKQGEVGGAIQEQSESVELPPIIVVRPQSETSGLEIPLLAGRVLAVNKENKFVIVDLGEDSGVKRGDTFDIYRDNNIIATVEVIQTRNTMSACDIRKENMPIKIGDIVK